MVISCVILKIKRLRKIFHETYTLLRLTLCERKSPGIKKAVALNSATFDSAYTQGKGIIKLRGINQAFASINSLQQDLQLRGRFDIFHYQVQEGFKVLVRKHLLPGIVTTFKVVPPT